MTHSPKSLGGKRSEMQKNVTMNPKKLKITNKRNRKNLKSKYFTNKDFAFLLNEKRRKNDLNGHF